MLFDIFRCFEYIFSTIDIFKFRPVQIFGYSFGFRIKYQTLKHVLWVCGWNFRNFSFVGSRQISWLFGYLNILVFFWFSDIFRVSGIFGYFESFPDLKYLKWSRYVIYKNNYWYLNYGVWPIGTWKKPTRIQTGIIRYLVRSKFLGPIKHRSEKNRFVLDLKIRRPKPTLFHYILYAFYKSYICRIGEI